MTTDETGFLGEMAASSRQRSRLAQERLPADSLRLRAAAREEASRLVLAEEGFDVIAEVKLVSPAEGRLAANDDGAERVGAQSRSYAGAGACAISVLTEPSRFGGALDYVERATVATSLPIMRKDFLVDRYQVIEARAAGASGVLVIARILTDDELCALVEEAHALGMFALVECFDERDIERVGALWHRLDAMAERAAAENDPRMVRSLLGVNCRDLSTLQVDFARLETLAQRLPEGVVSVAESGLHTAKDARTVAEMGYRTALVGSALMRAKSPAKLLESMVAQGREGARCASV